MSKLISSQLINARTNLKLNSIESTYPSQTIVSIAYGSVDVQSEVEISSWLLMRRRSHLKPQTEESWTDNIFELKLQRIKSISWTEGPIQLICWFSLQCQSHQFLVQKTKAFCTSSNAHQFSDQSRETSRRPVWRTSPSRPVQLSAVTQTWTLPVSNKYSTDQRTYLLAFLYDQLSFIYTRSRRHSKGDIKRLKRVLKHAITRSKSRQERPNIKSTMGSLHFHISLD